MDETTALLGKAGRGKTKISCIGLMGDPVFHLDDMEGRAYQIDRRMSGCYPLICTKPLNFHVQGRYYGGEPRQIRWALRLSDRRQPG